MGQVYALTYYEPTTWKNLPYVHNSSVTCDSNNYCIFRWEEIKSSGNNFIFISTPAPFDTYYSNFNKKIKISMIEEGK